MQAGMAHMEGLDPNNTSELRKAALAAADTFGIDEALQRPTNGRVKANSKTAGSAKPVKEKAKKTGKSKRSEKDVKDKPVKPSNQPLTFELTLDHKHPFIEERGFKKKLIKEFGIGHYQGKGWGANRAFWPMGE